MNSRRAPKGKTYDPCPGCGTASDWQPRPKNGVCAECRQVLDAHAKAIAEAKDMGHVSVGVPEYPHWFPYIHHDSNTLRDRFHAVVIAASVPATDDIPKLDEHRRLVLVTNRNATDWSPYRSTDFRAMPKPLALALRDLYESMTLSVECAYKKGKEEGRNLLAMLSAGELTTDDFQRRAGITQKKD